MDVSIFVETTFDDGESKRRNLVRLRRAPDEFGPENVGLLLDDAKTLLRRLQEAIVQDQVGEAIEARRKCDGCGNTARSMMIEAVFSTLFSGEFGRSGQGFDAACANRLGSRKLDRNHHLPDCSLIVCSAP